MNEDRGYRLNAHGLEVIRELTLAEWRHIGTCLMEVVNRTNWAIGDWLVYGDGRGEYGDTYTEAARITGRSFESLSQSARVSREFPIAQRGRRVPWSVYREALRLEPFERDAALAQAEQYRWTRDQFKHFTIDGVSSDDVSDVYRAEQNRTGKPERTTRSVLTWSPAGKSEHHRRVTCPKCHHRFDPGFVKQHQAGDAVDPGGEQVANGPRAQKHSSSLPTALARPPRGDAQP